MNIRIAEEDSILQQDLEQIVGSDLIDWEMLRNKNILVTGATGLIGGILTKALVLAGEAKDLKLGVYALVRNTGKADAIFSSYKGESLTFIKGDILALPEIEADIDYIVHGASVTTSRDFVDHPVETAWTILQGTRNMLDLAAKKKVSSMAYLSSMEVYGVADPEAYIMTEDHYGKIDPLAVRSSYSEGKRMAECLCACYAHEYQVPVKNVRLAQTFGAGIPRTENRVFAQFARSVMNGEDIILHTDGSKAHCYCYTADAIRGILTILLKGSSGQAYNVSNEATFGTIREMAQMVIEKFSDGSSKLVFDIPEDANRFGYAPSSRMLIDAKKLNALGWQAENDLPEMFRRLIISMKNNHMEKL